MTPTGGSARASAIRTFLIADIRGWTRFTNELGDEAASRLAAKFAQIVGEGVEAWGGELLELRGDEAMCIFGSARAALRCAVELQDAFADETETVPDLPLRVGIGLDAGEAVPIGEGFRGSALNLAARLCSAAAAGEVIASAGLTHLAGRVDGLAYAPLDGKPLKGFNEPVAAVLVAGERPHEHDGLDRTADRPSATSLPPELDPVVPLVGREADLRWLGWYWRSARHGHGGVVAVSGPAGMGRTRLAAELAAIAHGDGASVIYARGSRDLDVPLGPALVVLDDVDELPSAQARQLLGTLASGWEHRLVLVTHRDPPSSSLDRQVGRIVPDERRRVLAPLGTTAVQAVAGLYVERATEDVPVQLIFEESGGIPSAVHRVASQWARSSATRRLGTSAERTATERRELRAAESVLLDDLAELEHARERTRIYVTDDEADTADEHPAIAVCPYKGLATFEAEDSDYFFGRERLVGELIARLVGASFLGLIGASGSGKSSVLRAGLLPALAGGVLPGSDRWHLVTMRPGEHPMRELQAALAGTPGSDAGDALTALAGAVGALAPGQRLVLVIDQFEEVFSSVRDEAERDAFLGLVTDERPGLKVVVAMRADHYEHSAAYPRLAKLLGTNQVLVGPLQRDEVRAIIGHPATRAGLRVDPDLVEALVDDTGTEPGVLPLLSTALLELWQAREGSRLTLAGYRLTGGVRGAVGRLAEAAYARLGPEEQVLARGLFLRLAGSGEGDTVVRRRVPLSELDVAGSASLASMVEQLTRSRLLTTGDGYVELAHEALLREWPRLRGWLEVDATGRQVRLHLTATAQGWEERGRPNDDLYRGARLAAALDWAGAHEFELNAAERAFLGASREQADEEAARQRRTNRRLRALLGGAAIFLAVAIGAGAFALRQAEQAQAEADRADAAADEANRERAVAESAALVARSRELAASAVAYLDSDPALAKLLALSAATMPDPPRETVTALRQAMAKDRMIATYDWPEGRPIDAFAPDLHPNGRLVALGGWGSSMFEVIERESGKVLWSYDAGDGLFLSAPMFSGDGELLAVSVSADGVAEGVPARELIGLFLWRSDSGELVQQLDGGTCGPDLSALSERYAVIFTNPEDELPDPASCAGLEWTARELIDLETGERTLLTPAGNSVAINAAGSVVAYDDHSGDRQVSIVADVASGDRLLVIDHRDDQADGLNPGVRELSPEGDLLVFGDRPIRTWDVERGERIGFFHGHGRSSSVAMAFAPDGESVFSTGIDSRLRHWDARSGEEIASYGPITPERVSVIDGMLLVTREARSAALIATGAGGEVGAVETCHGLVLAWSLIVIGDQAALAQGCGGVDFQTTLVHIGQEAVVRQIPEHGSQAIALSPDGTRLVRQEGVFPEFGEPTIREVSSGEVTAVLEGTCVYDTTGERDDAGIPRGCAAVPDTPFPVWFWQMAWSPDGEKIIGINDMHDSRGGFAVWDASSGRLRWADGVQVPLHGTFAPDSETLIVAVMDEDASPEGGVVTFRRYSSESGELLEERQVDGLRGTPWGFGVVFLGYSEDGSTLFLLDRPNRPNGSLIAMDAETLEVTRTRSRLAEGEVKSAAISPDRALIATGSSDGYVRVWDARTFAFVEEIYVADTQIQGLAFVNDMHLAVAPEPGNILILTLNIQELIAVAQQSLIRGFTTEECERFNFEDQCPTLEESQGGGA